MSEPKRDELSNKWRILCKEKFRHFQHCHGLSKRRRLLQDLIRLAGKEGRSKFGGDPHESECLEDRKKFFFSEIYYT
jgi:hypothetical protein